MSLIGPRPLTSENFSMYPKEAQNTIKKMRPGLSGVGSIIFRNEETLIQNSDNSVDFYKNEIAPLKAQLEVWYYNNKNIYTYFSLIVLTISAVSLPNKNLFWKLFPNAPKPIGVLKDIL